MREVYIPPEIEPLFDDFKSFRDFLLQNMESKELTMIQKEDLIKVIPKNVDPLLTVEL